MIVDQALEAARAVESTGIEATVLGAQARVLTFRGDERAIELVQRGLELAREAGDHMLISRASEELAWDLMQLGRFEESLAACERGIETTRRLGMYNVYGYFLELARIETLYRMGRWADALDHATALEQRLFDEPPRHPTVPPALFVRQGTNGDLGDRLRRDHAAACAFGEDPCLIAATGVATLEHAAREGRFDDARAAGTATLELLLPGCLTEAAEVAASAVGAEADRAALARAGEDCVEHAAATVERVRAAARDAGVSDGGRIAAFLAHCDAELARARREACAGEWGALADRWDKRGERYPAAYAAFRAAEAELSPPRGRTARPAPVPATCCARPRRPRPSSAPRRFKPTSMRSPAARGSSSCMNPRPRRPRPRRRTISA